MWNPFISIWVRFDDVDKFYLAKNPVGDFVMGEFSFQKYISSITSAKAIVY